MTSLPAPPRTDLPTALPSAMAQALALAAHAAAAGEVPVGAVVTCGDTIIAQAHNEVEQHGQATDHAEILAIRRASQALGRKFLSDCTLWVTLEPCPMCAAALTQARLGRLVFAASDPKSGGVLFGPQIFDQPTCHHRPEVISGPGADRSEALLKRFFQTRR